MIAWNNMNKITAIHNSDKQQVIPTEITPVTWESLIHDSVLSGSLFETKVLFWGILIAVILIVMAFLSWNSQTDGIANFAAAVACLAFFPASLFYIINFVREIPFLILISLGYSINIIFFSALFLINKIAWGVRPVSMSNQNLNTTQPKKNWSKIFMPLIIIFVIAMCTVVIQFIGNIQNRSIRQSTINNTINKSQTTGLPSQPLGTHIQTTPKNQQTVQNTPDSAQINSRDQQRISDMHTLSQALMSYFQDHQNFPNSLADLIPKYLSKSLTAPTPADSPTGSSICNTNNDYKYQVLQNGMSYQVTFCIGEQGLDNSQPGINYLIPRGFL
jgi:hypothetical protein